MGYNILWFIIISRPTGIECLHVVATLLYIVTKAVG